MNPSAPPGRNPDRAVLVIIVAELFCTSLWFSANGTTISLQALWNLTPGDIGWLTNATQLGFIIGTLGLAATGLADKYPANRIFLISSIAGAAFNAGFALLSSGLIDAIGFRFATGLALAGIYPIGMKLVLTWTNKNTGMALALLIGMLTLGTALPHGIRALGTSWDWQTVILASSVLALLGGAAIHILGDGPNLRPKGRSTPGLNFGAAFLAFKSPDFRAAAFGYFGHMWELYGLWTIVPLLLAAQMKSNAPPSVLAALAFWVIAIGAFGCIGGGRLAKTVGSAWVAFIALAVSGAMCALFPLFAGSHTLIVLGILTIWGMAVVADSPQFSSLSAHACPQDYVGSALAIQNSIGFALTLPAIFLVTRFYEAFGAYVTWMLVPGPVIGLIAMRRLVFRRLQSRSE